MNYRSSLRISVAFLAPLAFFAVGTLTNAQQKIPDARLRVTVQQKEKGKLNPAFHVQELRCFGGKCSLTTVTLNSCRASPASNHLASPVVIERTSTDEGDLKVSIEGNTLVTIETGSDIGGNYTTTQRFTYEKPRAGETALNLISYSGGSVKTSVVAKQVITIEYIPLKEGLPGGMHAEATLNCPLGLPALTRPLR